MTKTERSNSDRKPKSSKIGAPRLDPNALSVSCSFSITTGDEKGIAYLKDYYGFKTGSELFRWLLRKQIRATRMQERRQAKSAINRLI